MTELPLVAFRRYVDQLTDEQIITFEAWDKEAQQNLYKKLLPTKDSLVLEHAYRKQRSILFKPESIRISHKYNYLYFYIPAGQVGVPLTDELLDYIIQLRSSNVYFEVKLTKKIPISNTKAIYTGELVALYEADYDFDTAKELLQDHKPIDLLMYAIGYVPTAQAIATKLALIIPLFKFNDRAIHTVTFTPSRAGKSRTAHILKGLASCYVTPMPSPARLVYDGARGMYGLTYFYNTLYIDEFDKIQSTKRKDAFRESYEILLTGMSDGVWVREVSSKVGDFHNLVSFCFMGNVDDKKLADYVGISKFDKNHRDMLYDLLKEIVVAEPFVKRICYVEFIDKEIEAYKFLNYNDDNQVMYLHPKVSRAIIKILQDKVVEQPISRRPKSELDEHFNELKAVLTVLGVELDDYTVEKLVKGSTTFLDVLQDDKDVKDATETKVKELDEQTLKEMLDSVGW